MINKNNIGKTNNNKNIVILVIILITINSKLRLEKNKIVTKQIHFL